MITITYRNPKTGEYENNSGAKSTNVVKEKPRTLRKVQPTIWWNSLIEMIVKTCSSTVEKKPCAAY